MIMFGASEIILSRILDFDQLWWLSNVAAVMSFTYSSVGLALGIGKVVGRYSSFHSEFHYSNFVFRLSTRPGAWSELTSLLSTTEHEGFGGSLTGISIGTVTEAQKIWRSLQAFGDIAFAYSYSIILIEIQV